VGSTAAAAAAAADGDVDVGKSGSDFISMGAGHILEAFNMVATVGLVNDPVIQWNSKQ
jgi:hypothetical protein